jgi:hypothetical protein
MCPVALFVHATCLASLIHSQVAVYLDLLETGAIQNTIHLNTELLQRPAEEEREENSR